MKNKRHQEIIKRFMRGETLPSIGLSFNVTTQRISQVLKKNGIDPREYRRNNLNQMLNTLKVKIRKDLKDGLTSQQIINKYKLSKYQVTLLLERGIDLTYSKEKVKRDKLINKLYMKGYTAKEIIKEVKEINTVNNVYLIVKNMNGGKLPTRPNTVNRKSEELTKAIKRLRKKHTLRETYGILLDKGYTNSFNKPLNFSMINYHSRK